MSIRKTREIMFSEDGSVMVVALLVFMIITLLGSTIISVSAMESKVALADAQDEQARQAADAGVELARNVAMNYISLEQSGNIPVSLALNLGNNTRAEISCDTNELDNGILTISSRGILEDAAGNQLADKIAKADIKADIYVDSNGLQHRYRWANGGGNQGGYRWGNGGSNEPSVDAVEMAPIVSYKYIK